METIEVGVEFGAVLKEQRTRYSLSQKALAKLSGLPLPILRLLEQGQLTYRHPHPTLERLQTVLNHNLGL